MTRRAASAIRGVASARPGRPRRRSGTPLVLAGLLALGCGGSTEPTPADPNGGNWATWVLASGASLRPANPGTPAAAELTEVLDRQAALDAAGRAAVDRWNAVPSVAWNEIMEQRLSFYWALLPDVRTSSPPRAGRALALLNIALYDAMVAVWDAKYAYGRQAPATVDTRVNRLTPDDGVPSFPSEHAAAAAAAAEILAASLPDDDRAEFDALAQEAAASRIAAGAAYPSDVAAGWAIGKEVARQVLAYAATDGSDAPWTGAPPAGAAYWKPTPPRRAYPPFDPTAGNWRPWVLTGGDQFRPLPHPDPASAEFLADLNELRNIAPLRTVVQADVARFWATDPPSNRWIDLGIEAIDSHQLSALRAARVLALTSVAMNDAFIACWDAKFHYWLLRPITADSGLVTVFATPAFPSYPSGHSTISAAAAEVLAYLFPDDAAEYRQKAAEASLSRVWGGVHYRFDLTAGEVLGRAVGDAVVDRAGRDGADGR